MHAHAPADAEGPTHAGDESEAVSVPLPAAPRRALEDLLSVQSHGHGEATTTPIQAAGSTPFAAYDYSQMAAVGNLSAEVLDAKADHEDDHAVD